MTLATGPRFLPGPALLLCDRFPATRPTALSLLLGQRAALSPDRLLGSAVTDMSLSLRLFPQAQPRFSLRQRGRPSLHTGIFRRAAQTRSGQQQ